MTQHWKRRFETPIRHTVRPARGGRDASLVVTIDSAGPRLAVWTPEDGMRPAPRVDGDVLTALLMPDASGILRLRDPAGDELGHVWLADLDGGDVDLTPGLDDYTLRGIDTSSDGRHVLLTTASSLGFEVVIIDVNRRGDNTRTAEPRRVYRSISEAWNGRLSADGTLVAVDTTDHQPGVRRFAVTVLDAESGQPVARLFDEPAGTARTVRFSPRAGDDRLLAVSEKTGFARPVVWHPRRQARIDIGLPDLRGDVVPLDWSPDTERVLAVHVDDGVHRLLEIELSTENTTSVPHESGAVFQPDIATSQMFVFASHYAPDGAVRVVRTSFADPCALSEVRDGVSRELLATPAMQGTEFASHTVTSADGLRSQLWVGTPRTASGPVPTILEVHGGPTYVTTDRFDPVAQAWVDEGFAFASLNFRGSVTFGRDFREAFVGRVGTGELDDIRAAVEHLVASGIADPDAVFITGESYGGYLTLLSLGRLPGLFAGGFAHVAVGDWRLTFEDSNPAMQKAFAWFFGGTPDEVPERIRIASPMTYVDAIRAPLWIRNGRSDTRTPVRQIVEFVERMRDSGGDVVLELFDGGHQTVTIDALVADQHEMLRLARRAIDGQRWSSPKEGSQ